MRKSLLISLSGIALFFFILFISGSSTPSDSTPPENLITTQKQAEAIQKKLVLPEKKYQPARNSLKSFTMDALEKLPTESDVRASVENNPHDTPESVMKAGAVIGYVADQMKKDSANVAAGLKFFKSCAENDETASTIRAVCLRNLVDFSGKYKNNVRVSFSDYPENIQRIARHIPRLR